MDIAFEVEGRPVPQGSMVASYNRKQGVAHVHHVAGEALAQWRASVRLAAREAGAVQSPSAIAIMVWFGMPRPKAHMRWSGGKLIPKMQHYYDEPIVSPDLDKLVRAILDALTGVCYADDAQVIQIYASKHYAEKTRVEVYEVEPGSSQQPLPSWVAEETEAYPSEGQLSLPDMS